MKRLLRSSLFASVQFLMVTAFSANALAGQKTVGCAIIDEETQLTVACAKGCKKGEGYRDKNGNYQMSCIEKDVKETKSFALCEGQFKDLQQAEQDQAKACAEAGMSEEKCVQEVQACASKSLTAEEESSMDTSALTQMMSSFGGQPLEIPSMGLKKDVCPTDGSKDFFEEKDRLQRDLKEIDRDNAEAEKDIAEEKSKLDKEMKDAKEDVTRAKKEVDKKKLELNKEKVEKTDQAAKQANEISEQLRKLQSQDLEIRAKMTKFESDHTEKLRQLTDDMSDAPCMVQVKKTHDEMLKAGIFDTSNSGEFMANAGKKKAFLQAQFNKCKASFRQRRLDLEKDYLNQSQMFNQELLNIQEGIQSGQNQQKQAEQQLQQSLEDLKTEASNEDQNLIQQMQNAQSNLTNLQQTIMQKQNAIRQKQASLQLRKIQLQKDLDGLGATPKRGTKTGWRDAERAVFVVAKKGATFNHCCDEKDSDGETPFADTNYCDKAKKREWSSLLKESPGKSTRSNRSRGGGTSTPSSSGSGDGTSGPSSSGSGGSGSGGSGGGSGTGGRL